MIQYSDLPPQIVVNK